MVGISARNKAFACWGYRGRQCFFLCLATPPKKKYPQKWGMSTNPRELKRKLRKQKIRLTIGLADFCELLWKSLWCRGRDSNPHSNCHYPLKIACLPVPPPRHGFLVYIKSRLLASIFCGPFTFGPKACAHARLRVSRLERETGHG